MGRLSDWYFVLFYFLLFSSSRQNSVIWFLPVLQQVSASNHKNLESAKHSFFALSDPFSCSVMKTISLNQSSKLPCLYNVLTKKKIDIWGRPMVGSCSSDSKMTYSPC